MFRLLGADRPVGTITRRKNGHYQVKIRRDGSSLSKTFQCLEDARRWERAREVDIDRGVDFTTQLQLRNVTLRELLERWVDEVLPGRPSERYERPEILRLLDHPLTAKPLSRIVKADFRALLKKLEETHTIRGKPPSPDTVIRKWSVYRAAINYIRDEWDFGHWPHPMAGISLPAPSPPRDRRWEATDIRRLVAAWRISKRELVIADDGAVTWRPFADTRARGGCRNRYIPLIIRLAWETSARRSELLSIRVADIHLDQRRLRLARSATKNGEARWVPLTKVAINLIRRAMRQPGRSADEPLLFPVSVNAFKCGWRNIQRKARLTDADIRFHDGRREAISRGIDAGLTLPQVIALSGHKDLRAAKRYFAPDLLAITETIDAHRVRKIATRLPHVEMATFEKSSSHEANPITEK